MCTVSYLPTQQGFIFSSNRDESPLRGDTPLVQEKLNGNPVIFPRDMKGGSWIFISESGDLICVLNGAEKTHKRTPPYRESRGMIAKRMYEYSSARDFIEKENLEGIEPFTMIIVTSLKLIQLQWNGSVKNITLLDKMSSHIWSSSTLYTPEISHKKKLWFKKEIQKQAVLDLKIAKFIHREGSVGDPAQDYVMNRDNIVRTVSITHVENNNGKISIEIEDLIKDKVESMSF